MQRFYYSASIADFLAESSEQILGKLAAANDFTLLQTQRDAWLQQVNILKGVLSQRVGRIIFEFSIPRMGERIDTVIIIEQVIFVLEFKIGEFDFKKHAVDQVWDYALDLKNFHEASHESCIAPILISSEATAQPMNQPLHQKDRIYFPMLCTPESLGATLQRILKDSSGQSINPDNWIRSRYSPTPTIIEAAQALYRGHSVDEISRSDSTAQSIIDTSSVLTKIIESSRKNSRKSICFLTGVPGAGKTLVGLNIATQHFDKDSELYSVFLSGNGPLVAILREALARDQVTQAKERGQLMRKGEASRQVKMFIQNVHHFRDECLQNVDRPPIEHVALFDEAQRAWNTRQTSSFMRQKKGVLDFDKSEPEFLISCMDRHQDWAVIVCLVGGGQEINTGEAGITEWIDSLMRSFPKWQIFVSPKLIDSEYSAAENLKKLGSHAEIKWEPALHLSVSMRSFRAEKVSFLIKSLLDQEAAKAKKTYSEIQHKYPIALTRDLQTAKGWLKTQARGSERYGLLVSSQAYRLKPYGIDVRPQVDPIHWFLNGKEDVRSSYYLEDVATEFQAQGLELDWACVTWDADLRYTKEGWEHWSFRGDRWDRIRKTERQMYLKNAYRVLLTRARQGMVLVVPEGSSADHTRQNEYYDQTYDYLKSLGLTCI